MVSRRIQDLLDRRVPQYLAVYLGASWGLVEFLAFLEDRLLLSPHLTNLVLMLLALLLPSVALFTYHHGRPGADRWQPVEKVGIPLNVAGAALLLFVVFGGKDLGAVTTTVTTEDEQGNSIERVIPKSEFRKRLAVFPPSVPPADSAWLADAVVFLVATDLSQDVFLDLRVPGHYMEQLRERGLSTADAVPRGLKRQVAQRMHLGHFLDGTAQRTPTGFRVELALHDVAGGRIVTERAYEGPDLFALADSASLQLRVDLELPKRHVREARDLPVSELTTESIAAYEDYMRGVRAFLYASDYTAAALHIGAAVERDPTFAEAWFTLFQLQILGGDAASARESIQNAMRHLYRLPERSQFAVKAEHYGMQQDLPSAFAVHEMRAELYPQDVQAHLTVAEIRRLQDDLPGAIDALGRALDLDPTQVDILHLIGTQHERLAQIDSADHYFRRYANHVPDQAEPYRALARLSLMRGQHDAAREELERALLLEPGNVEALVQLSRLEQHVGDWRAGEARLREALDGARTPHERTVAASHGMSYSNYRGDHDAAVDYLQRAVAAAREHQPPVVTIQMQMMGLGHYVRAGRADEARAMIEALAAQLPPPLDAFVPFGRAQLWIALSEPDSLAVAVEQAEAVIASSGFGMLAGHAAFARGRLHELRGEWPAALEAFEQERKLSPSDPAIPAQLGRVHREMGDLKQAEELLLQTLTLWPSHARANCELGMVYQQMGRPGDAIRFYEQALDTWAVARDVYEPAMDCRAHLEQVRDDVRAVRIRG